MPPTWTVIFSIMAAITSAVLLYKASLPLLHGKSSFSGQTPFEAAFRVVAGMVAAAIAVLCSLAVALGAYLNMGVSN
jgi:hypothetical protein